MATVSLVIAVPVLAAVHAMQDMYQMPLQDFVMHALRAPTLHLQARHHALHVCDSSIRTVLCLLGCSVTTHLLCMDIVAHLYLSVTGDGQCQSGDCSASAGCSSCNAGYVPNAMTGLCDGCSAGQYAAAGDSTCSSCTSGTNFSFANAESCTACLL